MDERSRLRKGTANDIEHVAIRRGSSAQDFSVEIEAVYRLIGPYLGQSLEEFKVGFLRDTRPQDTVATWCSIATAWYEYHVRFLDGECLSNDQEMRIVAALIAISAGEEDMQCMPVAADVAARLLACYCERKGS